MCKSGTLWCSQASVKDRFPTFRAAPFVDAELVHFRFQWLHMVYLLTAALVYWFTGDTGHHPHLPFFRGGSVQECVARWQPVDDLVVSIKEVGGSAVYLWIINIVIHFPTAMLLPDSKLKIHWWPGPAVRCVGLNLLLKATNSCCQTGVRLKPMLANWQSSHKHKALLGAHCWKNINT